MELPEQAFKRDADGVRIRVHAQPGAKQSRIAGAYGETVKIAVATPPVDGKANKALQKLLAQWLNVSASSVVLASGMTGREKQFVVSGVSPEDAKEMLEKLL
jgi:uncharacterized protein (TIGR00251 family)